MDRQSNIGRFAGLAAFVTFMALVVTILAIYQTGIIPKINPEADKQRAELTRDKFLNSSVEGTFYDRNNIRLTQSNSKGVASTILYSNELSCIIGTRNTSGSLSGLRSTFEKELFDMDDDYDGIGGNIMLTLDIGLQKFAYSILKDNRMAGSINIIDADTGEILCMASRGNADIDFDANVLDQKYSEYDSHEGSMTNTAIAASTSVGSTFKIITGIGILEEGIEQNYIIENPFLTPAGNKIYNNEHCKLNPGDECNLEEGFINSVNTYFASRGLLLGTSKFMELAERFFIGESIELDFTTLKSYFSVQGTDPSFELASTAYGQGKTLLSPLHLTAIMAGIINDGRDMVKPYLIKEITNEGKVVLSGDTEYLRKNIMSKGVSKDLKELLHKTAMKGYGFPESQKNSYGYAIAKTGTCQTGKYTNNHIFILVGYSFKDKNYAICIDQLNAPRDVYGSRLSYPAKRIIDYLNSVSV